MDVSRYQGIHQFGRNYAFMLESDTHSLDSVDRVLLRTWCPSAPRQWNSCT